jgi:hypothetical protein
VDENIRRAKKQMEIVTWQWFEVIDFMYERPEFVNPSVVDDDYIHQQIDSVCAQHRKNNPLANGITEKFGKYWKDQKGRWHPEKRKRF